MFWRTLFSIVAVLTLNLGAADPAEQNDEETVLKDKSPDGLYALRVPKDRGLEGADDVVELVALPSKKVLLKLNDPEEIDSRSANAKLDWSPDSKRVAAYTGGRREGWTQLFVRDGDRFVEVTLPKLPTLEEEPSAALRKKHKLKGNFPRPLTLGKLTLVRWEKTGAVLELQGAWSGEEGSVSTSIMITLEIDGLKAKVKKSTTTETFHKS